MDKINNLNQTVELMISEDYKERFIAEYSQLCIRILKLERVFEEIKRGAFSFTCSSKLLEAQLDIMKIYKATLETRAAREIITLPEVEI